MIEEGDHVVIYLSDKKNVPEIEKLFQPSAFFILTIYLLLRATHYNRRSFIQSLKEKLL